MTRINVVPVTELTRQHLIAEYRELPRVFALAYNAHVKGLKWKARQPEAYTLGTGHMLFFYDKLSFLATRHDQLVKEMLARGYKPTYLEPLRHTWCDKIPMRYWGSYEVTPEALAINRQRIAARLAGDMTGAYTPAEIRQRIAKGLKV